jgi:two-component system chemotaxis response regulator CheY
MRVLIADDDALMRRILRASLLRAGHEVQEATSGDEAWAAFQSTAPRLVITDWMMPGMDGPDLIRRIRATEQESYTYTILLTARDAKTDVVRGLEAGADDYLSKPFNLEELRARVAIGARIIDLEARLHEAMHRLETLALHDSLTGLLNRRAIMEHATAELARARREGQPLSLILLDVDHFKAINDRHGHLIGDEALKMVAATLSACKRVSDWAGRWGGEEFLLVLPRTTAESALAIAERLRAGVAAASLPLPDGGALRLRISAGVCTIPPGADGLIDEYVREADAALYEAKRAGRDRTCLAQPAGRQRLAG